MIATIDIDGKFIYFDMVIATAYENSIKKNSKAIGCGNDYIALPVQLAYK